MKARLFFDVKFNGRKTDAESIAAALDNVVKCGMSALGDCWDEYGGQPKVGEFFVLDAKAAARHATPAPSGAAKYVVQHEMDDEPTYVVQAGTDEAAVTFDPSLPWQLRQRLARLVVAELAKG
jgi:hypothetical protein